MTPFKRYLAFATCAGATLLSRSALAQEAEASAEPSTPTTSPPPPEHSRLATANAIQIGLGFRYGISLNDGDLNPWGTGLGLDVGFTMPNAVYVGGNVEYFFGGSTKIAGFDVDANIWQVSGELGYDVGLGDNFVIRPKAGVGFAGLVGKSCASDGTCETSSSTKFAFAPGATLMLLTSKFSLSLDTRYDLIFTDTTQKGVIFSVGVGF